MPTVKIESGLNIYYEIDGQGDSVVLVQGLDRDHNGMNSQRKELSKHFQVIAYDSRGTGKSDTPQGPYTCRQMADDLYGLLKVLQIEKAHIIGASLGRACCSGVCHFLSRYDNKPRFDVHFCKAGSLSSKHGKVLDTCN